MPFVSFLFFQTNKRKNGKIIFSLIILRIVIIFLTFNTYIDEFWHTSSSTMKIDMEARFRGKDSTMSFQENTKV